MIQFDSQAFSAAEVEKSALFSRQREIHDRPSNRKAAAVYEQRRKDRGRGGRWDGDTRTAEELERDARTLKWFSDFFKGPGRKFRARGSTTISLPSGKQQVISFADSRRPERRPERRPARGNR
jgi:hypothetical protein